MIKKLLYMLHNHVLTLLIISDGQLQQGHLTWDCTTISVVQDQWKTEQHVQHEQQQQLERVSGGRN